jgi:predicted ATPase with chaperone activity
MAAIGAIPPDLLLGVTVIGELGLDGSLAPVAGVLPAAYRRGAGVQGAERAHRYRRLTALSNRYPSTTICVRN